MIEHASISCLETRRHLKVLIWQLRRVVALDVGFWDVGLGLSETDVVDLASAAGHEKNPLFGAC